MEKLIFVCPKTDQQVDIGVATEIGTLLRIRSRVVRAQCPACGETMSGRCAMPRWSRPPDDPTTTDITRYSIIACGTGFHRARS